MVGEGTIWMSGASLFTLAKIYRKRLSSRISEEIQGGRKKLPKRSVRVSCT